MRKTILLLLFFTAKNITPQNGFASYSTTIPSGTNPGAETALLVDNAGNKWIGFANAAANSGAAMAKYDGSSWTFYNTANTPSLPSNRVNALCKDNSGNIWIGTPAGLVKFNGSIFTAYTTANGLPSNNILSLDFISGMLYIGTDTGLSRFDGVTFTNYNVGNGLLPYNSVNAVKAENANTIWLSGTGYLLTKFSINSSYTSTSYTVPPTTYTSGGGASIYIDGAGNKWLAGGAPVIYDNVSFKSVAATYTDFVGADLTYNTGRNFTKGPNNGVLFQSSTSNIPFIRCLVEIIGMGNYRVYYAPSNYGYYFGPYVCNDGSNKIFVTHSIPTTTNSPKMYSFDNSAYNAFGQGPGGGVNSGNFKYLDINRVKAGISNRGDMWWDMASGNYSYEVPVGTSLIGGVHSGSSASIWLGGFDAGGQLHTAAQTYRQSGSDFWPGPLDTVTAGTDTTHVMQYDKIWKVSYNDINTFITQFNMGNVPLSYTPTPDILNWPAKGTGNNSRNLAPFVDVNSNGIYDPMVGGDYPKIKGDETLYYIFNDNFTSHGETNGLPFGVEVHAMAYAYGCSATLAGRNELAYTTFYDYKIYNRSNNNYNSMYIGFWNDVDLGCYIDDYIGCDPNINLGFCYNSRPNDNPGSCGGTNSYGIYPPAVGSTVLKSPPAPLNDGIDNNHNGTTDEPGEELGMSVFDYYNNNIGSFPPQTVNPSTKYQYYNYLKGQWKDSTNFTCGGNAYGGTTATKYVYPWNNYPGNPCGTWTESTAGNLAGDRRYIVSSGPFNLPAKQMTEVEYAYVWSVDSAATSNMNIASVNKLISDVGKIRTFYAGTAPNCLLSINIGIKEESLSASHFNLFPNPGNQVVNVRSQRVIKTIRIADVSGRTVLLQNNVNALTTELSIQDLAQGAYFVTVSGQDWSSTLKLLKD